DLALLEAMDPLNAQNEVLHENLRLYRSLGKAKAQRYVQLQMAKPQPIEIALLNADHAAQQGDNDSAIKFAQQALSFAQSERRPQLKALFLTERCSLALI